MSPLSESLRPLLHRIIASDQLHARWLNTLSFLENCGARKIAACEHPTFVREEMLKHAAEEFRHAYFLKRQMDRLGVKLDNYALKHMLGGTATLHYLNALDLHTSRFLKNKGFNKRDIKERAYLYVTYAIELRAAELYPIYDELLRTVSSKVTVKSILLEEKEHLNEMTQALEKLPEGFIHAETICKIESSLFSSWLMQCTVECRAYH